MSKAMDQTMTELFNKYPNILTTHEVAEIMRVDPSTVIRWATTQNITCIQVGPRLYRFPKWAVKQFLQSAAKNEHDR